MSPPILISARLLSGVDPLVTPPRWRLSYIGGTGTVNIYDGTNLSFPGPAIGTGGGSATLDVTDNPTNWDPGSLSNGGGLGGLFVGNSIFGSDDPFQSSGHIFVFTTGVFLHPPEFTFSLVSGKTYAFTAGYARAAADAPNDLALAPYDIWFNGPSIKAIGNAPISSGGGNAPRYCIMTARASLLWDFGDGNTSTSPNPTHTYASAGSYSVSLTYASQPGVFVSSQPGPGSGGVTRVDSSHYRLTQGLFIGSIQPQKFVMAADKGVVYLSASDYDPVGGQFQPNDAVWVVTMATGEGSGHYAFRVGDNLPIVGLDVPSGSPPPLRQRQRDDGLAGEGPRVVYGANQPTSFQQSVRRRPGHNNSYG